MNAEEIIKELRWLSENDEWVFAADITDEAADLIESLQAQLAKAKRRAKKAVATIKSYDQMGWFCRWRDGGACTINGKREICRKGTDAATKNPCHDWAWRGDYEDGEK